MKLIVKEPDEVSGLKRLLTERPLRNWSNDKYPIGEANEVVAINGIQALRQLIGGQLFLVSRDAVERIIKRLEENHAR